MKLCKSLLLSLILIFSSASFAIPSAGSVDKAELAKSRYKKELHTADTCQSIYKAIGIFIYLADEHWKKEKEIGPARSTFGDRPGRGH